MTTESPVLAVPARVSVVDVDMPFSSIVGFILKWTLASIPAILMLMILGFMITAVFAGIFESLLTSIR